VPPNSPAARYMASDGPSLVARVITIVVILGALLFAVQGGEFGTLDLVRQRRTEARLTHEIDSLRHVVDTLAAYDDKVEHDPATQERIAREVFGMVRGNKELLYRFTTPRDSASTTRDSVPRRPK
jgi:cell division protein FtsB